jgi:hypothetical protein
MFPNYPGGHEAYQDFVVRRMRDHYANPAELPSGLLDIAERFWRKDLTGVNAIMRGVYSPFGPRPRPACCMLRSYLLSIALHFSVTKWVDQMRIVPAYAILSGFEFGDTPGVGTFADFFTRLWQYSEKNFSPHEHPPKAKVTKPNKKGEKAAPVERITVSELLSRLEENQPSQQQPFSLLFKVFQQEFLNESVDRGLLTPSELALSGDGTPVVTSAQQRKKRLCVCKERGISSCDCNRYYTQPDCDIGWDSSRGRFYHGYDLYMLTASDSESDLPVFPLLQSASRHDSHGFLHCFFTMKSFLPEYRVSKLLLDPAHDAMPIYEYCRRQSIVPFIALNEKRGVKLKYKNDFTIGTDGIPVCMAGLKMRHDGVEVSKHRSKFRCPLMDRRTKSCSCTNPCSDAKWGRTVHLATKDNPRLINIPPRDSQEWKIEYNARTSSERCNKRMKYDFQLENGRHRSSKMWYCRLYATMMLQHLFAWQLPFVPALQTALLTAG